MSAESPTVRALEELRFALAQADADAPPSGLRTRVLTIAEGVRPPGRPLDAPPAISPVQTFRRTVEAFHTLLIELRDDEWARPALRGLDVQGLVGHLIGVERAFHVVVGLEAGEPAPHVAGTQPDADAQLGRPPEATRRDWLARASRSLAYVDAAELDQTVTLHGFTLPLGAMLVVRSFEMWIHEEDIRRATGRALVAPEASRLALMTELAVAALPRGLDMVRRPQPGRTARLVLTGPGGGVWQAALDRGVPAASPDVRIVADATSFCRLVANRLDPVELDAIIDGDVALAADVLAGASCLALD